MKGRDNQLRLALLGKPQFEYNGQPMGGLTLVKGQALLAYLAVTRQPHSRSALAGLLWSEMPETDARANLRVTLSQLRKAVNDYLIVTRRVIEFNRNSSYWLDVEVLENAAQGRLIWLLTSTGAIFGGFLSAGDLSI